MSIPPASAYASRTSGTFGREVSFFDAVYGFAATLLISNVDAPPAEAWRSLDALLASGVATQSLGFLLSFVVIVAIWRANVRLVRRLRGLDSVTTVINLGASASAVFLAFTTQGISDPHSSELPLPTALYALNIAVAILGQSVMFQVARARGLERVPTTPRENLVSLSIVLVTPAVFVLSVPMAFWIGPDAAKLSWLSLLVLGPISGIVGARILPPRSEDEGRPGQPSS